MKRKISVLIVALMILGLLSGCNGSSVESETPEGAKTEDVDVIDKDSEESKDSVDEEKELIVSIYSVIQSLDPHKTSGAWDSMVILNMHDALVRIDENGDVKPALAESWRISDDGLEYRFYLREGVTFQDGTPFTAADVKFSIERAQDNAHSRRNVAFVDTVEVIDDYEVVIHAKHPSAGGIKYLGTSAAAIVSEKIINEVGEEEYTNNPIGTGPYVLKEWKSGDRIVLEAYEDYYLGSAPIKNLVIRSIAETTTAMIALETGEIDMVLNVPEMDKRNIMSKDGFDVLETSAPIHWTLMMNFEKEPFNNKLVRNAIYAAIEPEEIVDVVLDGQGEVAETCLHPKTNGYVEGIGRNEYNPEKAKELLAEAGYPDGFATKIYVRDDFTQKTAQVLQSQLGKIGIDLEVEVMQFAAWLADAGEGDFTIWPMGLLDAILDCEIPLSQLISSGIGSTNYSRYNNPKYDELHSALLNEVDLEKREEIITELLTIEKEDTPRVPLYFQMNNVAFKEEIENVKVYPNNLYFFYEMSR